MNVSVRPVTELSDSERSALRDLNAAVYPPAVVAEWPGRSIEWAPRQWSVIVWDDAGLRAAAHAGVVIRQGRWNDRAVKVGGVGSVMTHPDLRRRGNARAAVNRAIELFKEQGDVDFALLVCAPSLISFYSRLFWREFPGDLLVEQRGASVRFTFNLPMTYPLRLTSNLDGTINLLGAPW